MDAARRHDVMMKVGLLRLGFPLALLKMVHVNPGSDWNPVYNEVFLKEGLIRDDLPKIGQVLSTEIGEMIPIYI